jgi:hypothetical protein
MNCQVHSMPIIRILKATRKGMCSECLSSSFINIERERLKAEKCLDDLCRQYEDQRKTINNINKRLERGTSRLL